MASLAGITSEADRKTAQAAAASAALDVAAAEAAKAAVLEEHVCRGLKSWASQTGEGANDPNYKFRESMVSGETLTTWEGELQAAGYVVTRADGFFTVSLSA